MARLIGNLVDRSLLPTTVYDSISRKTTSASSCPVGITEVSKTAPRLDERPGRCGVVSASIWVVRQAMDKPADRRRTKFRVDCRHGRSMFEQHSRAGTVFPIQHVIERISGHRRRLVFQEQL